MPPSFVQRPDFVAEKARVIVDNLTLSYPICRHEQLDSMKTSQSHISPRLVAPFPKAYRQLVPIMSLFGTTFFSTPVY